MQMRCHISHKYFNNILLDGDQLTVARICGCPRLLSNAHRGQECLEGLIPVVEDWHAKMCFMKVHVLCIVSTCIGKGFKDCAAAR